MKKRFLLVLLALLLLMTSFTACLNLDFLGKEEEEEEDEPEDNGGGTLIEVPTITGKTPETDAQGLIYTNYSTHYSVTGFKANSTALIDVVIPATFNGLPVKSVGNRAFNPSATEANNVVRKITVSEGITDIEASAFADCVKLEEITLPSTVTSLKAFAFARCHSLESVTIPASVAKIGENIFESCEALENITVADGNPSYASADGVLYSKDMKTLIRYPAGKDGGIYTVPAGVTTLASGCFQGTAFTEVNLTAEVIRIEPTAFKDCTLLTAVKVPSGYTSKWWTSAYSDATSGSGINEKNIMKKPAEFAKKLVDKNGYLRSYVCRTV